MRARNTLIAAFSALAFTPLPLLGAQEGDPGLLFSLNLGLSIWTIVVFLLVLWILGKFAWDPMLEAVDSRERRIREALDEAEEQRREARELAEAHRKQLAQARRDAQELIAQGREAGEKLRSQIEEKARKEAQALLERARAEIGRERDAALDILRRETADLALAAASQLLGRRLDAEEDRKLMMEALDEFQESKNGARR